jgi:hypothetical protein
MKQTVRTLREIGLEGATERDLTIADLVQQPSRPSPSMPTPAEPQTLSAALLAPAVAK